jgi:flagellar hook-length control protein FliK
MNEILMTPQSGAAPTQASGRSAESRAGEAAKGDTETGPQVPFAAVLKAKSEKQPTESGKEVPSDTESPPIDGASDVPTVAAPDLLTMLVAEHPLAAKAEQTAFAPATPPAGQVQLDPLAVVAPAAPPTQAPSPSDAMATFDTSRHPAGIDTNPGDTVSPTPTFLSAETPDAKNSSGRRQGEPGVDHGNMASPAPDKLAVDAAIAATSAKAGTASMANDLYEQDFRTAIDRASGNPAAIGVQTSATSAPMPPAPGLRVETPLGQPGWRDEVGQKLTWMVSNNRQQAELVLNPPQLGRIEVALTIEDDRASVSFATPHAAVRETLENSVARLREMLADAGVTLGQTQVGTNSGNDPNPMHPKIDRFLSTRPAGEGHAATIGLPGSESAWRSTTSRGMVDVFA